MIFPDEPGFLEATFLWSEAGYQFSRPPPVDLLDPNITSSSNPWMVLAGVLERAKSGQHEHIDVLLPWLTSTEAPLSFRAACLTLVGAAGMARHVEHLGVALRDDDGYIAVKACQAALDCGDVFLVPEMIATWERHPRERGSISAILSHLLESEYGSIVAFQAHDEDQSYTDLVLRTADTLASRHGARRIPIFGGEPAYAVRIAERMLELLRPAVPPGVATGNILVYRRRFEGITGLDCRSMFRDEEVHPLAARDLLEQFLGSRKAAAFEPGIRYFFGHPIPGWD